MVPNTSKPPTSVYIYIYISLSDHQKQHAGSGLNSLVIFPKNRMPKMASSSGIRHVGHVIFIASLGDGDDTIHVLERLGMVYVVMKCHETHFSLRFTTSWMTYSLSTSLTE